MRLEHRALLTLFTIHLVYSSLSAADTQTPTNPQANTFSGDSPEAKAIHRRLMQDQVNRQQFQKQEQIKSVLSDRTQLQNELNEIDERLSHNTTLSKQDKKALSARRDQISQQIKLDDQKLQSK